jgi:nicotinate-nucleotide pyrophosphorylase (carboxylating)
MVVTKENLSAGSTQWAQGVGADQVLLDNMSTAQMAEEVSLNAGRALLEASKKLTLARAGEVGDTGVDYLAAGARTHSAPVLDIAMDLRGDAGRMEP